eukprot:TRINITY_DN3123_c0_g1_i4.p1 TRINITY_DN3123_c0_g1~~TRINITY_DN3123_c0_g1_i4.p1  ORF type:complete len:542 (+),score=71.25 TRINITY_DN3123_c0_g1_i4:1491-3116(+)
MPGKLPVPLVLLLLLTPAPATSMPQGSEEDGSIVQVGTLGAVRGVVGQSYRAFKGIRYAEPPVGERRWMPPASVQPWEGVWDATDFRESCMQGPFDPPITNKSEDCLYLNIYTPYPLTGAPYPVQVWLHGGSFSGGGGNESRLNGTWVASGATGVPAVVVTLNYRLNVFGFLYSEALRNRTPDNSTGNWGLQDQRMALRWVQQSISYFGGDPSNVMLYGESAGAASVSAHLTNPRSYQSGLFHRAAMMSGGFALFTSEERWFADQVRNTVLNRTRCSGPGEAECLLKIPAEELCSLACATVALWPPVIDGVETVAGAAQLASQGQRAQVPIILGSMKDEFGASFHDLLANITDTDYIKLINLLPNDTASQLLGLYPPTAFNATEGCTRSFWAIVALTADFVMFCPARRAAGWFQTVGSWVYLFAYANSYGSSPPYFASHASDVPYYFAAANLVDDRSQQLARTVAATWSTFAALGTPNGKDLPDWPRFLSSSNKTAFLDVAPSVVENYNLARCNFWDDLLPPASSSVLWGEIRKLIGRGFR